MCLAAVIADCGFEVIGVDTDKEKIRVIAEGQSPIFEPGLGQLLRSTRKSLSVTADLARAVQNTQVTFVVVPTPSDSSGEFSLKYIKAVMRELGKSLARKPEYHLVVVNSTVMPGSMDRHVVPLLEKESGKKAGRDFGVCYNPEFIALGDVLRGIRNPDFVLVGESDARAGDHIAMVQKRVCSNKAPIERMSFVNAEVAKMAVNSFVTMKMSFANTLAEICERIPGGDVDKITNAIGRDKRIGATYLKGGLGYGGPCFPRDNVAFAAFSRRLGVKPELAEATDRTNTRQVDRIIELIEKRFSPGEARIGILGVTYKPNTDVVEASQALMVAEGLAGRGFEVHVFDPTFDSGTTKMHAGIILEKDADTCVEKSDVCMFATPWEVFHAVDESKLSKR